MSYLEALRVALRRLRTMLQQTGGKQGQELI